MSSINNNGNANDPNQLAQDNAARNLAATERGRADTALNSVVKTATPDDIIALMGMPPEAATKALSGTPKPNKFTVAGAAQSLPPPAAPTANITPDTQQHFTALSRDVNHALGNVAQGAQPINFSAFTPTIKNVADPAQAHAQAATATAAAQQALHAIGGQFGKVGSNDMTMAFMMLRVQGQSQGLNINNQMGDMQSSLRKIELDVQIAQDQKAQKALEKAQKKQKQMGILEPIIAALMAVITVAITVITVGTGTGLAIAGAAMLLGFVAGGAAGGAKKGKGFDIDSALMGLSAGAMVLPIGMAVTAGIKAAQVGLSKALGSAVTEGAKKATQEAAKKASGSISTNLAQKSTASGASAEVRTQATIEKEVADAAQAQGAKGVSTGANAVTNAEKAGGSIQQVQATAVEDATKLAAKEAAQVNGTMFSQTAGNMKTAMSEAFGPKFMEQVKLLQGKMRNAVPGFNGSMVSGKTQVQLEIGMVAVQGVTDLYKNIATYNLTNTQLDAQEDINLGKMAGLMAKVAQDSWKGTQDFLSGLQEQHNAGVSQAEQILAAKAEIMKTLLNK